MSLDRRSQLLGGIIKFALGKRINQMSLVELQRLRGRQQQFHKLRYKLLLGRRVNLASVKDCSIPTRDGTFIQGRLYEPKVASNLPLMVFFHGGGWTIGNIDGHDALCRRLAKASNTAILSVGYRLAPEYKFPTALHDAYDAVAWAAKQGQSWQVNTSRLIVAGDSAGGNLATVVAMIARDTGGPKIHQQVLLYPVTNGRCESESHQKYQTAPVLNHAEMRFFIEQYCSSPRDIENPLLSPLLAPDLSNLPPALVITAENDPLRDEGEEYAARLQASGTPAQLYRATGAVHSFLQFPYLSAEHRAVSDKIKHFVAQPTFDELTTVHNGVLPV